MPASNPGASFPDGMRWIKESSSTNDGQFPSSFILAALKITAFLISAMSIMFPRLYLSDYSTSRKYCVSVRNT